MSKTNAPQKAIDLLKEVGLSPQDSMWNCHGTWVMLHKACEKIGAHLGISWEPPVIIEQDSSKAVSMIVTGVLGEVREWSMGEASPKNSKNAYPWAMAEKRGKDRVVLKFAGLHGDMYSEDESDDFKANKPVKEGKKPNKDMAPEQQNYQPTDIDWQNLNNLMQAYQAADRGYIKGLWNSLNQNQQHFIWANIEGIEGGDPKTTIKNNIKEWIK